MHSGLKIARRFLTEPDKRLLWKFSYNFAWHGMLAVNRFKRQVKHGQVVPAFIIISVTSRCNLDCQGCWIGGNAAAQDLSPEALDNIITDFKRRGSRFFGILGGEPLLYDKLPEIFAKHPECYFQLFTNGTLLTAEFAAGLRRLGNVTPLISVEGLREVSDERRGGSDVYERTMQALEHCRRNRLIAGVCTSVCASNIDELVTNRFLQEMARRGALYAWYYIYRPVGPNPAPELALNKEQVRRLRQFIVDARLSAPLVVVDAYWDQDGKALCPAATGISYHIGPGGAIEPCPPIQLAADNVADGCGVGDKIRHSGFLQGFRKLATGRTRGCILLEDPQALLDYAERSGALDSSGRGSVKSELAAMQKSAGHDMGDEAIPEKCILTRFAKKHWFFGFGAYG